MKILLVGTSPFHSSSGTGSLMWHLCDGLFKQHTLAFAGWGYQGTLHSSPWVMYPESVKWRSAVDDFKPDVLLLVHDTWRFPQLPGVRKAHPDLKIVGYFTVDGDPIASEWMHIFDACDVIVSPSQFGKDVIEERYGRKAVIKIAEGINTDLWKFEGDTYKEQVLLDVASAKAGKSPFSLKDNFVCLSVGQNQFKKNLGAVLDGFCLFADKHPGSRLILVTHSSKTNIFGLPYEGDYNFKDMWPWRRHLDKIRIVDQYLNTTQLCNLYKVSDAYISPSIGEGFGLFMLEAGMTKTMPIITDYSAFTEMLPNQILLDYVVYRSTFNVRRAIVSAENVAAGIADAFTVRNTDNARWNKMLEENQQCALAYTWNKMNKQFLELFTFLGRGGEAINENLRRINSFTEGYR